MPYARLLQLKAERYCELAGHVADRKAKTESEDHAEVLDEVAAADGIAPAAAVKETAG